MILVTGAGGKTGRAVIKALSKIGNVIALVRREEQAPTVESLGASRVIPGDLRDASTVRSAMRGARKIYHICPNMHPDEAAIGQLVIVEAQRAGIEHFVYHSVLHPQTEKMGHHWQKLRVEEMLFESGLPFTILQPAPYMQNLLAGWDSILADGLLRVPYSVQAKFSFVDLDDIAGAARIVSSGADHTHAVYELAGTEPLSHIEVAEIMSGILKREIRSETEEIKDWKLRSEGIGEYALENLVRMFEYYDRWGLAGNPNVLKWLLDREPTPVEAFIERRIQEQNAVH